MRVFPPNFWYYYRADLAKFLETPRSVFLGFFVSIVIAMAWLITVWCFALLLLPFLYSVYRAYEDSKSGGSAVALLSWSG